MGGGAATGGLRSDGEPVEGRRERRRQVGGGGEGQPGIVVGDQQDRGAQAGRDIADRPGAGTEDRIQRAPECDQSQHPIARPLPQFLALAIGDIGDLNGKSVVRRLGCDVEPAFARLVEDFEAMKGASRQRFDEAVDQGRIGECIANADQQMRGTAIDEGETKVAVDRQDAGRRRIAHRPQSTTDQREFQQLGDLSTEVGQGFDLDGLEVARNVVEDREGSDRQSVATAHGNAGIEAYLLRSDDQGIVTK